MLAPYPASSVMRLRIAVIVAAMLTIGAIGRAAPAAAATPSPVPADAAAAAEPGHWQPHSYVLHAMTFTSTYSCDGLADKLKLLLRLAGTSVDSKVDPLCSRGFGVPDKLAEAKMTFSTLQPGAAGPEAAAAGGAVRPASATSGAQSVAGVWRHVDIREHRPFDLQNGDCELIERFHDTVLPMFSTRNVQSQITCIPHQESGSNYSLSFDVFAPAPAAKSP